MAAVELLIRVSGEQRRVPLECIGRIDALDAGPDGIAYRVPAGRHAYLSSDPGKEFAVPPPGTPFELRPGAVYTLRGEVAADGSPGLLWLIEYDRSARLAAQSHPLRPGPLELTWRTHPRLAACRLALRLEGGGHLKLSDLELRPRADLADWSAGRISEARAALRALPRGPACGLGRVFRAVPAGRADLVRAAAAGRFWVGDGLVDLRPPVDWRADPGGDTLRQWKLHALFLAEPVLEQPEHRQYPAALVVLRDIVLNWLGAHPYGAPGLPPHAWGRITCAARALCLAALVPELVRLDLAGDEALARLLAGVEEHGAWLASESNYAPRHDQGLFMDFGLHVVAARLPFLAEAARWRGLAAERFVRTLADTLDFEEGVFLEHSPEYQVWIAELLELAAAAGLGAAAAGRVTAPPLPELSRRMRSAAGWLVTPDGRLPQLGDTDLSAAPDWARAAAGAARGLRVFWRAGLAAVRTDEAQLLVTAAYHGPGHKHADDLSFCLHERGQPVVIDSGNYGYYASDPGRAYCVSAPAHNVLMLDDDVQPWRGQPPYGSALRAAGEAAGWYAIAADDPLLAAAGARHTRIWLYRPGTLLLVVDHVAVDGGRTLRRHVHFAPAIGLVEEGPGRAWGRLASGQRVVVRDHAPGGPARLLVVRGLRGPHIQGFTFPAQRTWVERSTLVLTTAQPGTHVLLLALQDEGAGEPAALTEAACTGTDGALELRVATTERRWYVRQRRRTLELEIQPL